MTRDVDPAAASENAAAFRTTPTGDQMKFEVTCAKFVDRKSGETHFRGDVVESGKPLDKIFQNAFRRVADRMRAGATEDRKDTRTNKRKVKNENTAVSLKAATRKKKDEEAGDEIDDLNEEVRLVKPSDEFDDDDDFETEEEVSGEDGDEDADAEAVEEEVSEEEGEAAEEEVEETPRPKAKSKKKKK